MKSPVKSPASSNVSGSCGLCYKKTDQKRGAEGGAKALRDTNCGNILRVHRHLPLSELCALSISFHNLQMSCESCSAEGSRTLWPQMLKSNASEATVDKKAFFVTQVHERKLRYEKKRNKKS
ncbi:hypothetical protein METBISCDRAFT_23522 [Metschnikowia bicuspidata]|uniref:Uncharacterized protein n=1 Tax=Metschnikowia bicuspidata TaxID=27322 RepID=A0A4P9ZBM7_9ASCO|nr:hypothetical protein METBISCDRAFT_23522 [Metschnikowia bicuspidata]